MITAIILNVEVDFLTESTLFGILSSTFDAIMVSVWGYFKAYCMRLL